MAENVHMTSVVVLPDGRMDPKNASAYVGLSVKTMAIKRCNGTGPKFVKPGRVFYFREDLDKWVQRDRVVSTAQAQRLARKRQEESTVVQFPTDFGLGLGPLSLTVETGVLA